MAIGWGETTSGIVRAQSENGFPLEGLVFESTQAVQYNAASHRQSGGLWPDPRSYHGGLYGMGMTGSTSLPMKPSDPHAAALRRSLFDMRGSRRDLEPVPVKNLSLMPYAGARTKSLSLSSTAVSGAWA